MSNSLAKTSSFDPERVIDHLSRSMLGFTPRFGADLLSSFQAADSNYPPFNLIESTPERFEIVMAVAGFTKEDLEVKVERQTLSIKGTKPQEPSNIKYRHHGLATRSFAKSFILSEQTKVTDVSLQDGLLTVVLEYEVPEEQRPRLIEIK